MKRITLVIIAVATGALAVAQVPKMTDGAVFGHDVISAASALTVAQHSTFGTARSMAMGGAFTSLGADMASTAINPAGLGMYRHNDVSITMAVNISSADTPGTMGYNSSNNTRTTFGVNNVGLATNVYKGKGAITSVNMAITYNKVANFNYETSYRVADRSSSFAYALRDCAEENGLTADGHNVWDDKKKLSGYNMSAYYWGNVLGYSNYLLSYYPATGWVNDTIGDNPNVGQFYNLRSSGSAGETSIAFGANSRNKFYFGFSLDITTFTRRVDVYYGEEFGYDSHLPGDVYLNYFNYDQSTKMTAVGVRAKFGVTYRPTPALRLGVAFHTPTYYSVNYYYEGAMSACRGGIYYTEEYSWVKNDVGNWKWSMVTPLSVLLGASYTIGNKAILSVDYQFDEYDALHFDRVSPDADLRDDVNYYLGSIFQSTHSLRGGLEIKPTGKFAIRGGGGWNGCVLRDGMEELAQPIVKSSWYFTCGLGFSMSQHSRLDLAYSFRDEETSAYRLFYSTSTSSDSFNTKYSKHNVAVTYSCYF